MFKIYLRLLTFVRPIGKYAVPYFIYSILHALFNTVNYIMLIPIIQAMFDPEFRFEPLYVRPEFAFDEASLSAWLRYAYTSVFGEYNPMYVLILLATVTVLMNLLSNTFRYLGAWTVENMRTRTLQRMRNELFDNVINLNVGFFSEQRKGDIMSRITQDVMVVQFCITNTLQVSFREPFLIVGYIVMMVAISWELSIFSILFLPVVALIIGSIVKRLRHPARTNQHRMGEMVSTLEESLAGIKVIKTSAGDGSPVENAVYSIEGVTCAFSTSVSTGPDGSALVEDLPAGVYIVREESVPEPFVRTASEQTIALRPGKISEARFEDYTRPGLEIVKRNIAEGSPIE